MIIVKTLLSTKNKKDLTNLIEKNFNQMNHNSFWDRLKKEAKKLGLEEKVSEIAKLHLEASKEVDGVYYLEFADELIKYHYQGKLDILLKKREAELNEELVKVLLESVQKSITDNGFLSIAPLFLEVIEAIIKQKKLWKLKAYLYNQYVIYYLYANQPKKALESIKKAMKCKIDSKELMDRLLINKGLVLYKLGNYNEAISLYNNIEKTTLNKIDFKLNLSLFYKELGEFSKALELLFELVDLVKYDKNQLSKVYGNISNLYGVLGRKEKQREYLICSLRASKLALDINYETVIANYFNLANFYINQKKFKKGEFWLNVFKNYAKQIKRESDYFFNYAQLKIRYYLKKDDFFSAKAIIEKVLPNIDKNSSNEEYLSFLIHLGVCYLGEKNVADALNVFQKSIIIATKTKHNEFIQTIQGYLGICYYILGDELKAKESIKYFFNQEYLLRENIGDLFTQFYFSIDRETIYHTIIEILVAKNETLLLFEVLQNVKSNAVNFNSKQRIDYKNFVAKMDDKTLFVDYYLKEKLFFALLVQKGFNKPILIKFDCNEKEVIAITKQYFQTLSYSRTIVNFNPFLFLKELSDKIILPLAPYIKGKEKLIISRSSKLNLLPLHIFPFQDGLLFEKIATSYALNSALIFFEPLRFGNALLIASSKTDDSKKAKEYFFKEIDAVEKYLKKEFKIKKIIEDSNSKEKFFNHKSSLIHLVNHGIFRGDKSKENGMFLKENGVDVFISIDELFKLKIDTDFIFMSGCSTGEVYPLKGEEPLGIISYLHSNGIKSAILSSWNILSEKEITINIVKDFYKYWIDEKLDKSIALQKAMINNKKPNPHEYAGFVLFGRVEYK